jgi:NAD(P)-dependent dehydrogenase (short-subunit alcohol dehydrogenase family)/acyl carrier protein
MAIDTACSSSLVCLHLACESLRSRETKMALAGGINLMLSPEVMVSFSQARMLSADGRCKTFDAAADGYVRGEGCGMVLLKRLSEAMTDGDRIVGVIRGTAVDHGGASPGLTVPSRASQERVMRRALDQAGVAPADVAYVEAHGTGTSLGDPIEIEALAEVYGRGRAAEKPLLVGSVKTNIGHLESGSGMAGLIKILLSFEHGRIPAHLHFARPNPHIPWSEVPVWVAGRAVEWPRGGVKRIAGVSAFGFSGTNAHAVVEEPPMAGASEGRRTLLLLSARSDLALSALAGRYEGFLHSDYCRAAAVGRNHFAHRMARVLPADGIFRGQVRAGRTPRAVFVFAGQGARFARELCRSEPRFREAFERCPGSEDFAADHAWAELWKSWGVRAVAFVGKGVGEYVAACQAGEMPLETALRLAVGNGNSATVCRRYPAGAVAKAGEIRIPSVRSGKALERAVASVYVKGLDLDWTEFFPDGGQPRTALPNYPFERQRFWLEDRKPARKAACLEENAQVVAAGSRLDGWVPPFSGAASDGPCAFNPDWMYQVTWEQQAGGPAAPLAADAPWMILPDETDPDTGSRLAALLGTSRAPREIVAGTRIVLFCGGREVSTLLDLIQSVRASGEHAQVMAAGSRLDGWVPPISGAAPGGPCASGVRIWVVTRDAVEAGESPRVSGLAQSALHGFARGAMIDRPELFGALIDLDPVVSGGDAELLLSEILRGSRDDVVAFRNGIRYVPRLIRLGAVDTAPLPVSPSSAYLITGGYGFIGLRTARWLVDRGARSLILAGRNAPSEAAAKAIRELRGQGADVRCEQFDAADPDAVGAFFRAVRRDSIPLRGIVHAAGVAGFRPLAQMDRAELDAVLRPKVQGARLLHEHSVGLDLDFFLLFSSIASAWGSRDQAHYGAANRFLDALAHHRRRLGLPAQSINWGPWAEGGMTSSEDEAILRRIGVKTLDPESAIEALNHLPDCAQFAVADIDWHLFQGSFEARGQKPFLDRLRTAAPRTARETGLPETLRRTSPLERRRGIAEIIEREAAQVLGFGQARLDRDRGFFDMGMDSLLALELRTRLEAALGIALQATVLFDYPSIDALAGYCAAQAHEPDPTPPALNDDFETLRERVEEMSEEEAEAMLLAKLEAFEFSGDRA